MAEGEVDCNCGIFVAHTFDDVYDGLHGLQNRGRDATGIFCIKEDGKIDGLRWQGMVRQFGRETGRKLLDGGVLYVGEVRYSTNRGKTPIDLVGGGLPRFFGGEITASYGAPYLPHIVIRDAEYVLGHNGHFRGFAPRQGHTDTDVALMLYAMNEKEGRDGAEAVIRTFPATFACAAMQAGKNQVKVFQDRYAIRPFWIGEKDGRLIASSEDEAIRHIHGSVRRMVTGGEIVTIPRSGTEIFSETVEKRGRRPCFFERMYIGNVNSSYEGIINIDTRRRGGVSLMVEMVNHGLDLDKVDYISYLPNSPIEYARAASDYSGRLGKHLPLVEIFYKIDSTRSFMGPDDGERKQSIKKNLCLRDRSEFLMGKGVLIFDDSVVRFNNAFDAALKLDSLGLAWKGLAVATPELGPVVEGVPCGCEGGIDMPPDDNFAIRKYDSDNDKMARENGWDYLFYLSKGSLEKHVLRRELSKCCARCIGEPDPVPLEDLLHVPEIVERVYWYWSQNTI